MQSLNLLPENPKENPARTMQTKLCLHRVRKMQAKSIKTALMTSINNNKADSVWSACILASSHTHTHKLEGERNSKAEHMD